MIARANGRWSTGTGNYRPEAARRLGWNMTVLPAWQDDPPDLLHFAAMILLGGPPNVHEEDRYPFLRREKEMIRAWLALDKPILGFCLGHQLLADALQGEVGPNFMPSVGFLPGHLTLEGRNHPLFASISTPLTLFKWHGQGTSGGNERDLHPPPGKFLDHDRAELADHRLKVVGWEKTATEDTGINRFKWLHFPATQYQP